jgi:hypothetical protein
VRRRHGRVVERFDLEIAAQGVGQRRVVFGAQAADEAVGGEHGQTRILERHQAHKHVAVRPLAADLLRVDAGGLVTVVAVGDEQLGPRHGLLHRGDRRRVVHPSQPVDGAVVIGGLCPHRIAAGAAQGLGDGARRVGEHREDGGEVGPGGARESEAVLARAGMGALMGPDAARPILLHAHAREVALPGAPRAVGTDVVLGQRPQRGNVVEHHRALLAPVAQERGSAVVPVLAAPREVDPHDVVGRPGLERRPLRVVDHVIRRGDDVLEAAGAVEVVAQCADRLDLCHRRRRG